MKTTIITISCIIQFTLLAAHAVAADITKPNTFTNGTTADATQVNANFDTVYAQTNKNTSDIATAIKTFTTRTVKNGYASNGANAYGSQISTSACETGEILTGGSCSCDRDDFVSTTTNYGLVWKCSLVANSVVGLCGADSIAFSASKFGPPITTYAICSSQSLVNGLAKTVAKNPGDVATDPYQSEREAAIERMTRDLDEYIRMRQGNQ